MLKGLGAMGDMAKMMKTAQQMQGKMAQLQEDMHNIIVEGESGAGLVKATCTAKGELKSLDIDPSIFNGDEKEVVEDLILAAIKPLKDVAHKYYELRRRPLAQFATFVKEQNEQLKTQEAERNREDGRQGE